MRIRIIISVIVVSIIFGIFFAKDTEKAKLFCDDSPFNTPIDGTGYPETRITTIRQNEEAWSLPIYRINRDADLPQQVKVVNEYSGRLIWWEIPTTAIPADEEDHHLAVFSYPQNVSYEMWNARWQDDGSILAGGMQEFALNEDGISYPANQRVTAAGFAVSAGMLVLEDFMKPNTKRLNQYPPIRHALTMSLHRDLVTTNAYISPAVGGETLGNADDDGIPMGARFILGKFPKSALDDMHPITRMIALSARDYGIYVNDTNTAPKYRGGYVGNVRIEVGLIEQVYNIPSDDLIDDITYEMAQLIDTYGLYRNDYTGDGC